MSNILKYAYEYRNPQGLKIQLDEAGLDKEQASNLLVDNLDGFSGYSGKQYNYLTDTYQTLPEWINWFLKNRGKIKVGSRRRSNGR